MYGYGGRILRVDLTSGQVTTPAVDPELARKYIGGRGFAARIIYDEVRGVDPLSPANKIVIASGPMAGVFLPAGAKTTFAAKSPATGIYGDSNLGGHLAAEMKYAGYDAIVIEGAAAQPVYICVEDDKVEVRDAMPYWGQGAIEAERRLKEALGDEFQIAIIGPGGENLVKYACVGHDIGRQAGRTGIGAVMGSKKLKAIAVKGTRGISLASLETVVSLSREMLARMYADPSLDVWHEYGLGSVVPWANSIGALPTRNFQSGSYEGVKGIDHETMKAKIIIGSKGCFGCPMCCGKFCYVKSHQVYVEGPEYETTALIGSNCAFDDIEDVAYANYLCDELGLDTISAGNAIAFAMECYEKGVISDQQTEGVSPRFGDVGAFEAIARKIAYRQGIGDVLAEGVRHAAQTWGKGSEKYAIQVKGLEWSGYESRAAPANMLAYITADIGSHHNRAWAITHDIAEGRDKLEGKAEKVIELQHIRPLFDCLGVCRLQWVEMGIGLDYYAKLYQAVTGLSTTWDDLLISSERVYNLTRAYAIRELPGFGREHDYPPARFMEESVPTGATAGSLISRDKIDLLLDDYYRLRGWDANGLPTAETLRRLDLEDVAKELGSGAEVS